jgi:hypothetical protein
VKRTQHERGVPRYDVERFETHWWACPPGGRRTYLGRTTARFDNPEEEAYDGFRFAGGFLAFHLQYWSNYGREMEQILEADLSTGRRSILWAVRGAPWSISHVATPSEFQAPFGPPLLVPDAQGEVAWVIRDERGTRIVLIHNRLGTHNLASYPRAEAEPTITDLAISRGPVSWIYNGTTVTTVA